MDQKTIMKYAALWIAMAVGSAFVGLAADLDPYVVTERIWFIGTGIFACWICFGKEHGS
jgi:hypothetical protein